VNTIIAQELQQQPIANILKVKSIVLFTPINPQKRADKQEN
jgi:hypothetical protein